MSTTAQDLVFDGENGGPKKIKFRGGGPVKVESSVLL